MSKRKPRPTPEPDKTPVAPSGPPINPFPVNPPVDAVTAPDEDEDAVKEYQQRHGRP